MYPLQGLKVLDFSHSGDGPICGLMLAQAGADVIKIESLQGDPFRHGLAAVAFYNSNRNKRSLALNLHAPGGREVAHRLASMADIIIESFTPGVADRLGIGYVEIDKINPRIIYCSVSGFGQTGPYSQRPIYDPVMQAMKVGYFPLLGRTAVALPSVVCTPLPFSTQISHSTRCSSPSVNFLVTLPLHHQISPSCGSLKVFILRG